MEEPGKEPTGIFKPEDQVVKDEPEKKVLEGDEVPESLRGKSLDDVAKERGETEKKLQELAKQAEEARKEAETLRSIPPQQPAAAPPKAPERPFDEKFYENPEKYEGNNPTGSSESCGALYSECRGNGSKGTET